MSDIVFRRINGRIVPIKRKIEEISDIKKIAKKTSRKDIPALATVGAGFGVSAGGGLYAGKMIKNSWNAYRSSAHLRGEIKVLKSIRPSASNAFLYKEASKFKLAGKALATRGFGLLAVSGLVGSSLAGYGAYKYLDKKVDSTKAFSVASTVGAVASGAGIAIFARKAKVKHLISALRATGKTTGVDAGDISKAWSRYGQERSRATIKKYADIASSGYARQEYSRNISKTIEQLKKISRKKSNFDPNQGTLF